MIAHDVRHGVMDLNGCVNVRDVDNQVIMTIDYPQTVVRVLV